MHCSIERSKAFLLFYASGMRVIVHTANLLEGDIHRKTQALYSQVRCITFNRAHARMCAAAYGVWVHARSHAAVHARARVRVRGCLRAYAHMCVCVHAIMRLCLYIHAPASDIGMLPIRKTTKL